jgi:hypothetical protein
VESNGEVVIDQMRKLSIFTDYYTSLLGTKIPATWRFDLQTIYKGTQLVDPEPLTSPLTPSEAKATVQAMNKNSAPGPDGFGSTFYCAVWNWIEPQLRHLLESFYNNSADLARINRAHIILLAKKAWHHHPRCLQADLALEPVGKTDHQNLN